MKTKLLALYCLFIAVLGAADARKRAITHEELWLMKRVGAPVPSPDGKWAVFSVTQPAYEAKVFECFRGGAFLAPDALAGLTELSAAQLSATLMMLELKRLVAKRADGAFEARG